jgi:hypothetical protein
MRLFTRIASAHRLLVKRKYPGGPVRQQPWPPSFAGTKAVTTGAGFIERQRLQLDMKVPLGGTSCFFKWTTVT